MGWQRIWDGNALLALSNPPKIAEIALLPGIWVEYGTESHVRIAKWTSNGESARGGGEVGDCDRANGKLTWIHQNVDLSVLHGMGRGHAGRVDLIVVRNRLWTSDTTRMTSVENRFPNARHPRPCRQRVQRGRMLADDTLRDTQTGVPRPAADAPRTTSSHTSSEGRVRSVGGTAGQ